jgi:hypothetical protein
LAGLAVSQVLQEALAFAKASFYFLTSWSAGKEKAGSRKNRGVRDGTSCDLDKTHPEWQCQLKVPQGAFEGLSRR